MTDTDTRQVYAAIGDYSIAIGTGDMERAKSAVDILNNVCWDTDDDPAIALHVRNLLFRDIYELCETNEIYQVKLYLVRNLKEFSDNKEFMELFIKTRQALNSGDVAMMRAVLDEHLSSSITFSDPILPIETSYLGNLYRICTDLKDFDAMITIRERWAG